MSRFYPLILPTAALVFGVFSTVDADITTVQRYDVDTAGGLSMFATNGEIITSIAGDKSRTDTKIKVKSRVMRTLSIGGSDSTDIVRLDRDLTWQLDPKRNEYTELTFEQMRAQMAQGMNALEQMQQNPDQPAAESSPQSGMAGLPVSEQNCQWTEAEVSIEHTGLKDTLLGMEAEQHIISVNQTCTDPESGKACDMTWSIEQWLVPENPGGQEALDFWSAYAGKMGLEELMGEQTRGGMQALFAMYQNGWDDLMDEAENLEGYPVRSIMQMEIGGDECTNTQGQPVSTDNILGEATAAGVEAGSTRATGEAGRAADQAVTQGAADAAGGGISGDIAGTAAGAFGKKMAKGLFGKFKKKPAENAPPEQNQPGGPVQLFRTVTEVTAINTEPVDPAQFEIPPDWTRVELPPMPVIPPTAEP
jgi:hypothetical protein